MLSELLCVKCVMAAVQGAESLPTSRCVPWPAEHTPAGSDWWTVVWSDQWASSSPSLAKLTVYTHPVLPGPDSRWVSKSLYSGLFCLIKRLISLLNHLSAFCVGSDQLRFVCLFLKCTFLFCVLFRWTGANIRFSKSEITHLSCLNSHVPFSLEQSRTTSQSEQVQLMLIPTQTS